MMKELIILFWQARLLNIFELNYVASSEKMGTINKPIRTLKKKRICFHIISFLASFCKQLIKYVFIKKETVIDEEILVFFTTPNQKRALTPIFKNIPNTRIISETSGYVPLLKVYLFTIPFIPLVINHFYHSKGYKRESFYYFFDGYLCVYGYYLLFRLLFLKSNIKVLAVANDHSVTCTAIAKAAKDAGVKTVYIQHANVTENFPPLKFDYAFLEGYDTLLKYDLCGKSDTKVFLIGMPRFDAYFYDINKNTKLETLGICTNALDPFEKVEKLVKEVRLKFSSMKIVFRPHPFDINIKWTNLCKKYSLAYSDSRAENSFEYFKTIDALIVGDSSIVLESVLVNVYPLLYDFTEQNLDHYGFYRNGLVEKYHSIPVEIIESIHSLKNDKPNIRSKARRYCDTIGTQYDGKSSFLGTEIVKQIVNESPDLTEWHRIESLRNIEAYRLNDERIVK